MDKELEITFRDVNHEELSKKIQKLGGKCIQEKTLMKRIVFENPHDSENSFFRLRDEGNKITCTYKNILPGDKNIDSVSEVETEVTDFEAMKKILLLTGLKIKAYQETYRETWSIGEDVYFMLDEWPGITPFIEIESSSKQLVEQYTNELGFDYEQGIFGAVDELYFLELGIPHGITNTTPEITFQKTPQKYMSPSF